MQPRRRSLYLYKIVMKTLFLVQLSHGKKGMDASLFIHLVKKSLFQAFTAVSGSSSTEEGHRNQCLLGDTLNLFAIENVDTGMCSFCLLAYMELILVPNCSSLAYCIAFYSSKTFILWEGWGRDSNCYENLQIVWLQHVRTVTEQQVRVLLLFDFNV